MTLQIKLEPRTERAGLFSLEEPLVRAIKELNDDNLSMKRSTRGFTALYKNKPMNPVLAGKDRQNVEKILHQVFAQYVKHLTLRELQKSNFKLKEEKDSENEYILIFESTEVKIDTSLTIIVPKDTWMISLNIETSLDKDFEKSINILASKIGRKID
ncbi:MAG: hypothetical protein ACTSPV_14200 [Candidatus Hodarchaeales archaeon]